METSRATYRSYLLRLWREDRTADWRALLANSDSDAHHAFANLESLFAFLRQETELQEQPKAWPRRAPLAKEDGMVDPTD